MFVLGCYVIIVVLTLHLIIVNTVVINTIVGKFDVLLSITEKILVSCGIDSDQFILSKL